MNENEIELTLARLGKSAPRITSGQVDAAIVGRLDHEVPGTQIQLCVLTLYNGLTVTGVNEGPVSPDNHVPDIGRGIAYDRARDKVWGVLGTLMAEQLYRGEQASATVTDAAANVAVLSAQLRTAEDQLQSLGWTFDGQWHAPAGEPVAVNAAGVVIARGATAVQAAVDAGGVAGVFVPATEGGGSSDHAADALGYATTIADDGYSTSEPKADEGEQVAAGPADEAAQ